MRELHGHTESRVWTPTYSSWVGMKQRCYNPRTVRYEQYGGRGIEVCPRWFSFANFLADMGERPEGTTLDRIDNNGNYCKENCRWASSQQQRYNISVRKDSKSGVKGVARHHNGWQAHITINRKRILLYSGPSFESACAARKEGEQELLSNLE